MPKKNGATVSRKETLDECPYHFEMQCFIDNIQYDFELKKGTVFMPDGSRTDMSGCIRVFEGVDKEVESIDTYSGGEIDISYIKTRGKWEAQCRRKNHGQQITDR